MANRSDVQDPEDVAGIPTHPVSFVLRCRVGRGNVVHARLTDVRTGVSYPVRDLSRLPALLQRLVQQSLPSPSSSDPE